MSTINWAMIYGTPEHDKILRARLNEFIMFTPLTQYDEDGVLEPIALEVDRMEVHMQNEEVHIILKEKKYE